jgi:hypothetical protein
VAAAAAIGHGLPALLEACADLGISLTPQQQAQLQAWHAQGGAIQLLTLPVLRTATPQLMAQLLQTPALRDQLGDLLSSTVAALAGPPADAARRLRATGFFPATVESTTLDQRSRDQGAEVGDQESGDRGQRPATDHLPSAISHPPSATCHLPSAICHLPSAAPLWLAGQLYALLGQHLTLPQPPPFADLQAIFTALPVAQQAALTAQWEQLAAALLDLLDGHIFAPPPEPTDPARWRPLIEQAIAAGRSLEMTYFTAGRNLLTRRVVTPYWLEEHRGIPYLRADCHQAGKVLLFRLDRIQELQKEGDK